MEFNKYVFPAPKPSYTVEDKDMIYIPNHLVQLNERVETNYQVTNEVKIRATVIKTETLNLQKIRTEHHIPCLLLNERKINNGAIVYFHANAEDVGMTKGFGKLISKELNMAFFSVEYPGYGIYQGICTSDEVIKDAHAVIKHVIGRTGVEKIIVIGRSIGSGMAVDIASKYSKLFALLLISPFTSLRDVVKESAGDFLSQFVRQRFRNLEKMSRVKCPTLFIHGSIDNLIPKEHSIKMLNECSGVCSLQVVEGMDHNTFDFKVDVIDHLKVFLNKIKNQ